jgi:hypothetical protein
MRKIALLLLVVNLIACAPDEEQQVFVDPLSGKSSQMTKTSLKGWEAIQYTDKPTNTVMLTKSGHPIVSVLDDRASRMISFGGKNGAEVTAFGSTNSGHINKISFSTSNNEYHILQEVNGKWEHSVHTSNDK